MSLEIENIEKSFYCASKEVFHICNNFFIRKGLEGELLVVNLVLTLLFRKQFQKSDYFYVKLDQLDKMTMNFQLKCLIMGIAAQVRLNTIVHICWQKGLCTPFYCLAVPFLGFTFFAAQQQMVLHTCIFSLSESQESITTPKSLFHIFGILMEPKSLCNRA